VHIFNHLLQALLHEAQQTKSLWKLITLAGLGWTVFPDLLTPEDRALFHQISEI
jgi:hypothetical protein